MPADLDVWLDDERPAPNGWHRCRYTFEVVALLKAQRVRKLSLDHDLGFARTTGYHLVLWMMEHGKWPAERPTVHSMNPVGAYVMRELIANWYTTKWLNAGRMS